MTAIILQTIINAPIAICFDLSRSIDLHKISTAKTNEEAIAGITSGLVKLNEQVTWRAVHLGIKQTLTTKITAFKSPVYFQDQMIKGAFKKMIHDHHFEIKGSTTLMTDHFYFESPFGILGLWANKIFLKKYMSNLLETRNKVIKEVAETGEWKKILPTN